MWVDACRPEHLMLDLLPSELGNTIFSDAGAAYVGVDHPSAFCSVFGEEQCTRTFHTSSLQLKLGNHGGGRNCINSPNLQENAPTENRRMLDSVSHRILRDCVG
ncbi:unnamed protein product [Merluccius merluccius]